MPPLESEPVSPLMKASMIAVVAAFAGWLLVKVFQLVLAANVTALIVAALAVILLKLAGRADDRRLARMHAAREGETMATFVFALDWRRLDPWVVRATWDCLQAYVPFDGRTYPFHADDRLEAFGIDGEELCFMCRDIARRAGRSISTAEENPWPGHVDTVADLVGFIDAQPHRATA